MQQESAGRENYLRFVFRKVPGGVWATDRELRITYAEGRVLGREGDPSDWIGRTVQEIVGADETADSAVAHHAAALGGESQAFRYECRGRWLEMFIEPLLDSSGNVEGCIAATVDVTERLLVEAHMEQNRRGLEEAQRAGQVGSFEWDIAQNRVKWSDELLRLYGLQRDQFSGTVEGFLRLVHPADAERTKNEIFTALQKGEPFLFDHRILRADGSTAVLHTRGDVIKDEGGNPIRIVGSCWDVTTLKATTRELETSVSLLHATINATADGILVVDSAGKIVTCNTQFLTLWRIPVQLAEGRQDEELLAFVVDQLEDGEGFLRGVRNLYGKPEAESWDVIHFRDGRMFERHSTAQRVRGEVVGRVWTFRDVTERERLLRRATFIADATRLLVSLDVENALKGVARLSLPYLGDACAIDLIRDGELERLVAFSCDAARTTSCQVNETALAGHPEIYASDEHSCIAVPVFVKGAVAGTITFAAPPGRQYSNHDLEVVENLASRASLSLENGYLFREAERALKARDEFLSIAAHEIRNPIAAIRLAVESLQEGSLSTAGVPAALKVIGNEDRRLARFVDELLDFGRIRSGTLHLQLEDIDLGGVVRDVVARSAAEIARSRSTLSVITRSAAVGQWDRLRLEQVVTNLLSNALKFGARKPIEISVGAEHGRATLQVVDHGIGIPADQREAIFQPFKRAVSTRHYGGLGLGLYIVHTIVEALGGAISVESESETGTRFTVELPQTQVH